MSKEELYKAINPVKYLRNYLEKSVRSDGRELLEFRPTIINRDSISKADGSALVKIGATTVICGITAELSEPDNAEPTHGFIVPNIDMTKLCSPKYRAMGVSLDSQILNQTLFSILLSSECIDLSDLCVEKGKLCWVLYCDLVCLDDDGSVLDVASIALVAALKSLKLPKVDYESDTKSIKVDVKVKTPLNIKSLPITSTFITFEQKHLLSDPTADEERISDTTVTISTSEGKINYVYQPGGNSVLPEQFDVIVKQAVNREKYVKQMLNSIFED